ncbi:MAG: hypothetical protein CMC76_05025 [Flavobacteriaceae bacterium]|nr:hypothetical protein [Flavobacteriaceae bacterium]
MEIIKDLGIITIVGGLIAFIIRSFIGKYFDQKAKNFELELSNKSDLYKSELEKQSQKYKSDLDIHLTKVSRFHEKRLETISDLYKLIVDVRINLGNLTSTLGMSTGDQQKDAELKEQRKTDAGKSYDEFRDYYDKKRIFIPENTCKLIDKLKSESFSVLSDYHFKERHYGNEDTLFSREILKEMNEKTRETIPSILKELESDFRKTVDVENGKQIS